MIVPWLALQAIAISAGVACLLEAVVWLLFYRNSSYGRDLEQMDRLGKRLDAAIAEAAADPVRLPPGRAAAAHARPAASARPPSRAHPRPRAPPRRARPRRRTTMPRRRRSSGWSASCGRSR
jgi:hypothetical protein